MSTAAPRKMQRFPRNALIFFPPTPPVSPLLSDPIFWGPWNWANTRSLVPLVVALLVVRGPGTPPTPLIGGNHMASIKGTLVYIVHPRWFGTEFLLFFSASESNGFSHFWALLPLLLRMLRLALQDLNKF